MVLLKIKGNKPFAPYSTLGDASSMAQVWQATSHHPTLIEHGERLSNLGWRMWGVRNQTVDATEDEDVRSEGRQHFAKRARYTVDVLERSKAKPVHLLSLPEYNDAVGEKLLSAAKARRALLEERKAQRAFASATRRLQTGTTAGSGKGKERADSLPLRRPSERTASRMNTSQHAKLWPIVKSPPSNQSFGETAGSGSSRIAAAQLDELTWSLEDIEAAERELAAQGTDLQASSLITLQEMKRQELARQCAARYQPPTKRAPFDDAGTQASDHVSPRSFSRHLESAFASQADPAANASAFQPSATLKDGSELQQYVADEIAANQAQPALHPAVLTFLTQLAQVTQNHSLPQLLQILSGLQGTQGSVNQPQALSAASPAGSSYNANPSSPFQGIGNAVHAHPALGRSALAQSPASPSSSSMHSVYQRERQGTEHAAHRQSYQSFEMSAAASTDPQAERQSFRSFPQGLRLGSSSRSRAERFQQSDPGGHAQAVDSSSITPFAYFEPLNGPMPTPASSSSVPGTPLEYGNQSMPGLGVGSPDSYRPRTATFPGQAFGNDPTRASLSDNQNTNPTAPPLPNPVSGLIGDWKSSPQTLFPPDGSGEGDAAASPSNSNAGGNGRSECSNCGATSTPLWRRDADLKLQCNACGLYLKLHKVPRPHALKQRRAERVAKQAAGESSGATNTSTGGDEWIGIHAGASCANCGTSTTPLWRKDLDGRIICNACGLYYKLHNAHRPVTMRADVIRKRTRYDDRRGTNAGTTPSTPKAESVGYSNENEGRPSDTKPANEEGTSGNGAAASHHFAHSQKRDSSSLAAETSVFLPPQLLDSQACPMGAWGEACCQNLPQTAPQASDVIPALTASSSTSTSASIAEALRLLVSAGSHLPQGLPQQQQHQQQHHGSSAYTGASLPADWAASLGLGTLLENAASGAGANNSVNIPHHSYALTGGAVPGTSTATTHGAIDDQARKRQRIEHLGSAAPAPSPSISSPSAPPHDRPPSENSLPQALDEAWWASWQGHDPAGQGPAYSYQADERRSSPLQRTQTH